MAGALRLALCFEFLVCWIQSKKGRREEFAFLFVPLDWLTRFNMLTRIQVRHRYRGQQRPLAA